VGRESKGGKRKGKTPWWRRSVEEDKLGLSDKVPGWFQVSPPAAPGNPRARGVEVSHTLPKLETGNTLKHPKTTWAED